MKRARQLDRPDLIPEKWKSMGTFEIDETLDEMRLRIASLTATGALAVAVEAEEMVPAVGESVDERGRYTPETQPRDDSGRFRRVLARLKQNIGDSGLTNIIEKIEEAENNENAGDYEQAAGSAGELIDMIDRIDTGALNPRALENVRATAAELGRVVANLPLPFGQDAAKVRYSDLPPALKDLIEDMIIRVADKIGDEDAAEATKVLESYKGGGDFMNQSEISSELSKLLRLLT
jgi:hypothetical protein